MKMADGRRMYCPWWGRLPIEYISSTLSLGRQGILWSTLFCYPWDGSFVIRSYDSTGIIISNEFGRFMRKSTEKETEQLIEGTQAAMEEDRDYASMLKIYGERRQMYCSRLPMSEWYLVTIMPYGTLDRAVENYGGNGR